MLSNRDMGLTLAINERTSASNSQKADGKLGETIQKICLESVFKWLKIGQGVLKSITVYSDCLHN